MDKEKPFEILIRKFRERKVIKLIPKNSKICDLGCGQGKFLYTIHNKIKEGVGVDWNVKSHEENNLIFIKSNLEKKVRLESNKFDVVMVLAVLEHLNNPQNLLNDAFRILKKDGRIIITTPSKLSKPILEFLSFNLGLIGRKYIKEHKNYFSKEELVDILTSVGFTDIKVSSFEFGMNNLTIAKKI